MQPQHPDSSNTIQEGPEDAPFEWLTSPASLDPIFKRIFSPKNDPSSSSSQQQRVLHVGCGTSRLGEHLVDRWNVASVVNVDVDRDVLRRMQARWEDPHRQKKRPALVVVSRASGDDSAVVPAPPRMLFEVVDYSHEIVIAGGVDDEAHSSETSSSPQAAAAALHGPFDLIVDKSTLDCLLCTESAAAHLLQHAYNSLSSQGGVYLLISFQHVDLLRPLLEGLTGRVLGEETAAAWQVQSLVMKRQVEDLRRRDYGAVTDHEGLNMLDNDVPSHMDLVAADAVEPQEPCSATTTQWSSGSFHPDAKYHQFVNVFICRKQRRDDDNTYLSREHVVEHVKTVCNQWWTEQNPILSPERMAHLQSVFGHSASSSSSSALSLPEAYEVLFTEAEREHLEYEHFLEDWRGFLSTRCGLDQTTMTLATALAFLNEVQ
jgi:hypothetical protein